MVEVDSARFHTSPSDRRNDARRDVRLNAVGYAVHRVREADLLAAPQDVLAAVRAARSACDTLLAPGSLPVR
ncbi:MAG: DUF559 domain-containing protein [Acidimicrobiia bacterium]|nr:DUF559 domain-containing protein [Acidimicrobiia bacterium]